MTYAASEAALEETRNDPRHTLVKADVADLATMTALFAEHRPDAVMHLAAESHVDRSIDGPAVFIQTNVVGTFSMLEAARSYWSGLEGPAKAAFRFHHISTDEVFGALEAHDPPFTETTPYDPRSPVFREQGGLRPSGARLVSHPYGLPAFVTNTTNNYGFWHFPEKLIPLVTINAIEGRELAGPMAMAPTSATGCSSRTMRPPWCVRSRSASPARPTRSVPGSRARTCRWCRPSAAPSMRCVRTPPVRASA